MVPEEIWERVRGLKQRQQCEFCWEPLRPGAWCWESPRKTFECSGCRRAAVRVERWRSSQPLANPQPAARPKTTIPVMAKTKRLPWGLLA